MTKLNLKKNIVIINKTKSFSLLTRPEIAPKGPQPGVITEVVNVTGTKNGKEFNHMEVAVKLEAKNRKGEQYVLVKTYNIADNGRGVGLFLNDYSSMMNKTIARTDLYEFNPESLNGASVVVDVDYSESGNEVTSVIKSFHSPAVTEPLAA